MVPLFRASFPIALPGGRGNEAVSRPLTRQGVGIGSYAIGYADWSILGAVLGDGWALAIQRADCGFKRIGVDVLPSDVRELSEDLLTV